MDVVRQRLERRDVDDLGFIAQSARPSLANQAVEADEKRRERFARAGGGGDQNVPAGLDLGPALDLRLGRSAEASGKPFGNEGIEARKGHTQPSLYYRTRRGRATFSL